MAKPATKIKAAAVAAPASREQAEALLKQIGELQREITRREAAMNDEIAQLKARYQQEVTPLNEDIEAQFQGLHAWAEANKGELLTARLKSVKMGTGEIGWRTNPPKVVIRGAETVVENLKRLGLAEFVRVREEPNKEAILNDPQRVEGVKGITITQDEEFYVKPYETELERVETVK